ncbi:hypothetical protein GQR58_029417 [Nymphon striatum]|nr:hypothetical protein GQR58_029417 [Nymphon striatum]
MARMVSAATVKNMPFIQLVGDQPVYALIVQIRYEHPDQFSLILPCMEPFHIHCSFIYAMDKRFHGSGLSDILITAGVIAEGSVDQALRGKHYKRSIRCLRLMYEALIRRLIQHIIQNGATFSEDIQIQLNILRDSSSSLQERQQSYDQLESDPSVLEVVEDAFERIKTSGSPLAMYWMSFIEMTEILMMNLHALRTQNWEEFKGSLRLMPPWMQIYDNDKYGKWMVEYWLELNNLPEETALYMKEGLFAQSMTGKPYSCLPLDLWIEMTMNKGSKLKAGWLKILKNEKRTRLKQDEQAVQDIDNCITEFGCDPFNLEKPQLRSLQSGVLASTALVDDFESAHKASEKLFEKFCNDRMLSDKISFYSTVHRNSRRNFSNPPPVTGQTNMTITKTEAMENKAMSSIVALAEAHDEKFNLVDVMDYRVTDECLPIFNINGTMKKTQKSKLLYIDAEDTDILVVSAYVADTIEGDLAIKRKQEIIDCRTLCPKEIADIIIPLHIHSGCDTTAAFFAHGKTTIYDKASASEDARVILRSVGKSLPVPQVLLDEMAKFTIKFVYNDKRSQTLGDARARKWTEMKKRKSTVRLPPDRNSHDLKIKRFNYQTFMMLNFDKADPPPSPINHGWTLDNGLCIPVRYTEPALPRYLSEVRQHHLRIGVDTGLGESDSDGDSDSDDDDDDDDTMMMTMDMNDHNVSMTYIHPEGLEKEENIDWKDSIGKIQLGEEPLTYLTLSAAHVVLSQLEEIKSVVKAVYQKPETNMGDYWLSFLEMTDPLAQNVHACHTQQYYEDVSSSYEMFPGLMAYNNHEYGRHLPDFWAMLNNLSEDQSRYFSLHFAQSQTGLPYSCQPMDLWIEVTMNLGSKLKAGWLQLLQDDKQLFSTIRNANAVGRICQALETQLNSKRKQSKHTDCQPARLRKDEKAVQDILTSLDAFECDLFGEDDPALRSIQSGIKTTESVALDLSVALPDGKAQADILLDQRVFSKDFKLSDRVPKNKRLTFDNNKVAKSGNKAISQAQMESAGLAAVIELAEGTGALTLEEIMENRVTEECLSIFNVDGSLRHTAKSKLFEHLNLQPTADKPAIYSSLIDMSMLFRLATPADREKKKQDGSDYKWQDYIDKICFMVHSLHPDAEQTYAINDPYPKPNEYSIKDDERDRRAASHPNAGNKFPTRDEKFPGPKEFSSFMSNSQNKVRLQNLVRQCLTNRVERNRTIWVNKGETTNLGTGEDHPDLIFNHTEADTMIFGIYAKLRAVYTQPIIIDSEDTDVYIQAAYVAKRTTGKMYIKRKKHLIDCTTLVDNEVADSIIAAHVISGSDHSSGFYHKGKASIIKCVITDAEARELLSGLGQEPELSEPLRTHPCPFGNGWALINGKCRPVRHSRPVLHSQENTDSDDSDSTGDTDSDTEEDTEYDESSESDLSEED